MNNPKSQNPFSTFTKTNERNQRLMDEEYQNDFQIEEKEDNQSKKKKQY